MPRARAGRGRHADQGSRPERELRALGFPGSLEVPVQVFTRQTLRAAAAASWLALAVASVGAGAQNTMQPATGGGMQDNTQPSTRTPSGARGEDPHYPASEAMGQGGAMQRGPGQAGQGLRVAPPGGTQGPAAGSGNRPGNGN